MRYKKWYFSLTLLLLTAFLSVPHASAQQEKIIVNFIFNKGFPGSGPQDGAIFDAAGNLYGVTYGGGIKDYGTVYEASPTAAGGWTIQSLYKFQPGTDGSNPVGGLVMDSSGNLYGTTEQGGTEMCSDGFYVRRCGTVFELSPSGAGVWSEKVIYNFSESQGWTPHSRMLIDAAGNLYGTTVFGGKANLSGTVFEMRKTGGQWTHRILHNFGQAGDGFRLYGGLVSDAAGNLYGTTLLGGNTTGQGGGIVYQLTNGKNGWKEKILFDFNGDSSGQSGFYPFGTLAVDGTGNVYGATQGGGAAAGGVLFELKPTSQGLWQETVVHSFDFDAIGYNSNSLRVDSAGNLYGTTANGGSGQYGTVFEFKPSGNSWTGVVLHSFASISNDGANPDSGLLFDSNGNLYGTTLGGGAFQGGTLFEITP